MSQTPEAQFNLSRRDMLRASIFAGAALLLNACTDGAPKSSGGNISSYPAHRAA